MYDSVEIIGLSCHSLPLVHLGNVTLPLRTPFKTDNDDTWLISAYDNAELLSILQPVSTAMVRYSIMVVCLGQPYST